MPSITAGNNISSSAQLGTDVVTLPAMANDSVDASNIKDGEVKTGEILDGTIVDADISASAAIADTKLAQITTAGKVSGAALTSLSSIPVGAGVIPLANLPSLVKFGGTGADGALSLTSGATNIDLAGASILVKNYTSISITGTGQLTFTNPHANGTTIILRSQGNVTLTSSATPNIEVSSLGGIGGVSTASSLTIKNGSASLDYLDALVHYGGSAGAGVAVTSRIFYGSTVNDILKSRMLIPIPGGGGASGGSTDGNTGYNGGRGGGALLIECGGALNYTSSIWAKGGNGVGGGANQCSAGGGAGGSVVILYASLTAKSGTTNVNGGNGGGSSQGQGPSGPGGANLVAGGASGAAGSNDTGTGGSAGGGYQGGGGGGASGYYLITSNIFFS